MIRSNAHVDPIIETTLRVWRQDPLFTWMAQMTSALHAHHAVTACTTVEQLATRWGSDAVSAAPATGEPTLAASALQGLVGLLHGTCGGESAEGEARVAALVAAEQCMAMCPSLIDPAFYRSAACQYTLRCKALGTVEEVACVVLAACGSARQRTDAVRRSYPC